jgi:serine/threonine protein kinase
MSPEQSVGKPADSRSDMLSLGLVLYEMLAGAPPFEGRSTAEHFHLLNYTPPPALRQVQPAVPEALQGVVMRMLKREPGARFADMREVECELLGLAADSEAPTLDPDAPSLAREAALSARPLAGPRPRDLVEGLRPAARRPLLRAGGDRSSDRRRDGWEGGERRSDAPVR